MEDAGLDSSGSGGVEFQAVLNTVLNLGFPLNIGNFLTTWQLLASQGLYSLELVI
jgi:hypothetical protein